MSRTAQQPIEEVFARPQPGPQSLLIKCPVFEVLFGGARGGGKTFGMLLEFAFHAQDYGQDAIGIMVRRQRTELLETIETSRRLYNPLGAKFNEQDKVWTFETGARLRFAYLERDQDANAYQGHSYSRVYVEEIGNFPSPAPIMKLMATLRSGACVPCCFRATGNPGGPGHQWVKARYIDGAPNGMKVTKTEYKNPWTNEVITRDRVFIPSKIGDNRYLGSDYVANLQMVGNSTLVEAWLTGSWDAITGQFFSEWSHDKHVIRPFTIPDSWLRFRSMDWGSAAPFSVGWWAVVGETTEPNGEAPAPRQMQSVEDWQNLYAAPSIVAPKDTPLTPSLPRGAIVRYAEWYGASAPGIGLKMPAEQVGREIVSRETLHGQKPTYGVLDPAAFASDGGPSIAERLARNGAYFRPADNRRVGVRGNMGGWDQVRSRLIGDGDGRPMLYVFSTCTEIIRTLPALQHDPDRPEDVDSTGEDHAPDELRYACMSRPFVRQTETRQAGPMLGVGTHNEITLNALFQAADAAPRKRNRV